MIAPAQPSPRYQIGQLIRHRRYGYRGVVVAVDGFCRAPEEWYQSNQTQPDRNQPWYHVLVDGGTSMTYTAQTSIEEDDAGDPIEHPLIDQFFSHFDGQRYIRNSQSFVGW